MRTDNDTVQEQEDVVALQHAAGSRQLQGCKACRQLIVNPGTPPPPPQDTRRLHSHKKFGSIVMFWTTIPVLTLVVLCSLWCTHAEETILGVDVYGDTLFSFGFTLPITTAATATAPDTTVTGGQTVVLGSTHMHIIEAMTIGSETVTFLEDCPINVNNNPGTPVCTIAELRQSTTILTVVPFIQAASGIVAMPATPSATPKNNGARLGVAGAFVLVVVAAGVALVGAIV